MPYRDGCFNVRGVWFWTDRSGMGHIVETPYSGGELRPQFDLALDYPVGDNGVTEARVHVERKILDGSLEQLIARFLAAQ